MQRRNFIKTTAAAASLSALAPVAALAQQQGKNFSDTEIKAIRSRIKPISKEERAQRIANAQKLMHENGVDVLLVEGGTSLVYLDRKSTRLNSSHRT